MRHSLNEIEVTLRKATVGSGIPVGLGEDIGRAAAWLSARGLDGAAAGLTAIQSGTEPCLGTVSANGDVSFENARIAFCGPSAVDFLIAGGKGVTVRLGGVDAPLLMIGFAGVAARLYGVDIKVESGSGKAVYLTPEGALGTPEGDLSSDLVLSLESSDQPGGAGAASAAGIDVDAAVWNQIAALAQKTYVPESEASRLQGAGAGLTDND